MPRNNIETRVGLITLRGKWKTLFISRTEGNSRNRLDNGRGVGRGTLSPKLTNIVPPNNVALMAILGLFADMGEKLFRAKLLGHLDDRRRPSLAKLRSF